MLKITELHEYIKEILPLVSYDTVRVIGTLQSFKAIVDCDLKTDEEVKQFIEEYTAKTTKLYEIKPQRYLEKIMPMRNPLLSLSPLHKKPKYYESP